MLTAGHLLAFNTALFLAVASPGPAFLVCVQASLTGGRRAGVLTGLGLAVVAGLWTLAALLGLDAVFTQFPLLYRTMKIGGAILMLSFAVLVWINATAAVAEDPIPVSNRRAFLRGVLLNLGNPKTVLFSAGVLLVIFPAGLSAVDIALITANHIALEAAVYSALAFLLSHDSIRAKYMSLKPVLGRATALVLGGLGIRLLVTS